MNQKSDPNLLTSSDEDPSLFSLTGTDSYSEFIHLSRYARWLDDKGRRENWAETVDRYVSFFADREPEYADEIRGLAYFIKEFKSMPSMRAMMTAGPALNRDNVAGYNCLGGETLVTTKEYGIVPISTLAGKSAHVVDGNGNWVLSKCKSYGEQDLHNVSFSTSGRGEFSVRSTSNHRWILRDGSDCYTSDLVKGDRVSSVGMPPRPEIDSQSEDYRLGIVHGIVYGDGTAHYRQSSGSSSKKTVITRVCKGFVIRLCSDSNDLLPFFGSSPVSYPPSFNGDPVVYLFDSGIDLKSLPDTSVGFFSDSYLTGFIRGWLAADGSVSSAHQVTLAATSPGKSWINEVGPRLGFVTRGSSKYPDETNLGKRKGTLYHIRFDRRWAVTEDFIITRKRDNFSRIDASKSPGFGLVSDVSLSSREEVYCFEVPTTNSFLLTKNLLTGNCSYLVVDHPRAFDETMYILMCGTGVGFSVERQYVSKLPEVAEEFHESDTVINVKDSRIGWSAALRELISLLYNGQIPKWNLDKIRESGSRLKTFGGRASGPAPLDELFKFCVALFSKAAGRRLSSIECHDLVCKIAAIVVVGGVRRCYPSDARILTPSGITSLGDLKEGDSIISCGLVRRVSAKVSSGVQKLVKVNHRFGSTRMTANHRVAVFISPTKYEFKMAGDLSVGDRLVWDRAGCEGKDTLVPRVHKNDHFNAKDIRFPSAVDPDLSWLVGLIQGDGYIGTKTVEISSNRDQWSTLERANSIFQLLFGLQGKVDLDSHGGEGIRLRINSVELSLWCRTFIKESSLALRVPSFIKESTVENRSAYLAGVMDADGRVRCDGVLELATSVYPEFVSDLEDVLLGLGISYYNYRFSASKRRVAGDKAQDYNTLNIAGNTSRADFTSLLSKFSDKLENYEVKGGSPVDFTYPASWELVYRNRATTLKTAVSRGIVPLLQKYAPVPVLSVEEDDSEETWDIEVEGIHEFTADGIVTHNSALLSLSNLSDDRMRRAKVGQWQVDHDERQLANNSACYTEKPDFNVFIEEWTSLYESKSGERGVFSRSAARKQVAKNGRRDTNHEFGTNPCSEILLRPDQLCNLSEVVVRSTDTVDDLLEKVRVAAIWGTLQATLTKFRYLRKVWQNNTQEERLLGVSLTGIMDHPILGVPDHPDLPDILDSLRDHAVGTNKIWAERLGIPQAAAVTCVKPSGTISQLVNSSSGIHPRFSDYYIRRVRIDKKDPIATFMTDRGFPFEEDLFNASALVFGFPIKSADNSVVVNDVSALQQLELWSIYQKHWCEHKPSCTVYYTEDEFLHVGAWVWDNFDDISGISFMPKLDHIYQQAPYEEITEDEYNKLCSELPSVNWRELGDYENTDNTVGSHTLACAGGACEVVDLISSS